MSGIKNWKGKKFHDPKSGKQYPMTGPFSYRLNIKKPRTTRFIPAAIDEAIKVYKKTGSILVAAQAVGASEGAAQRWLDKAGLIGGKKTSTKGKGRGIHVSAGAVKRTKENQKNKRFQAKGGKTKPVKVKIAASPTKVQEITTDTDVKKAFMACHMHNNNFPHSLIRKKLKINVSTLEYWLKEFGNDTPANSMSNKARVEVMLELSSRKQNAASMYQLAERFKVPVGVIDMLKREVDTYTTSIST